MKTFKLKKAERGLIENMEFTGFALFNHGQKGTSRPGNFGPVYVFNDDTLHPGSHLGMHPHSNVEIITIMISGEESHKDSLGVHENYIAGDVQLISAGSGVHHAGGNTSNKSDARHLQIWVAPKSVNTTPQVSVLRVSEKILTTGLNTIVSPAGEAGVLRIDQEVWISEVNLSGGQTIPVSARNPQGGLLIHVLAGSTELAENKLEPDDTLFVTEWNKVTIQALDSNPVYLILIETIIEQKPLR